jgi:endoglucanase
MTISIKSMLARLCGAIFLVNMAMGASAAKISITVPNTIQVDRAVVFRKAKTLDHGISISWLEQTWKTNLLKDSTLSKADFKLLKFLGFRTVRLPVAFEFLLKSNFTMDQILAKTDWVLGECKANGLNLIIDYHYGSLTNENYLTETQAIIGIWQKVCERYAGESDDHLFFEIYNEPVVNDQVWKDAAYNIVAGIRAVDKHRTLLVGASNYNSIYELSRFVRLADENIIYSFHFYEPFFFTHQGADWVGAQVATTGVPFPYNASRYPSLNSKAKHTYGETHYEQYRTDGNEQSLVDKLTLYPKKWSVKYNVPVVCTEYGTYNKYADLNSRCRYVKAMNRTLKKLNIPGLLWDYNTNFSIFNGKPSLESLPSCMKEAISYQN